MNQERKALNKQDWSRASKPGVCGNCELTIWIIMSARYENRQRLENYYQKFRHVESISKTIGKTAWV